MSVSQTEVNPDDPIVELPMQVVCSTCGTIIREGIAKWPQSHITMAQRNPNWKGTVVSHAYCDNCFKATKNQAE